MRFPWQQKQTVKTEASHNLTDELSRQGYRMTPQRMMIVDAIEHSENHISAEDIFKQVVAKYPQRQPLHGLPDAGIAGKARFSH